MIKKIIIVILSILFIFSLCVITSDRVNMKIVELDLLASQELFSLYRQKYNNEEIENLKCDNVLKQTILREFEYLIDEKYRVSLNDIYEKYSLNTQGDYEKGIVESEIDTTKLYILNEEDIKLNSIAVNSLRDKEYIKNENNVIIKILDIYSLFCYDNIEEGKMFNFQYQRYNMNKDSVEVIYTNIRSNKDIKLIFRHGAFGKLKTIEVIK